MIEISVSSIADQYRFVLNKYFPTPFATFLFSAHLLVVSLWEPFWAFFAQNGTKTALQKKYAAADNMMNGLLVN